MVAVVPGDFFPRILALAAQCLSKPRFSSRMVPRRMADKEKFCCSADCTCWWIWRSRNFSTLAQQNSEHSEPPCPSQTASRRRLSIGSCKTNGDNDIKDTNSTYSIGSILKDFATSYIRVNLIWHATSQNLWELGLMAHLDAWTKSVYWVLRVLWVLWPQRNSEFFQKCTKVGILFGVFSWLACLDSGATVPPGSKLPNIDILDSGLLFPIYTQYVL